MIAIVKYNAGNSRSVENAIKKLGYDVKITDAPELLIAADKIIFPGVGEAGSAMKYLREREIDKLLKSYPKPLLGICLGMQLMCNWSEEGDTAGLEIFNTRVIKFDGNLRVPHTGWNNISKIRGPLLSGISPADDFYFVHSFYAELCPDTNAECSYQTSFSAVLGKGNFFGTQFHPEKSSVTGMKILKNFLEL